MAGGSKRQGSAALAVLPSRSKTALGVALLALLFLSAALSAPAEADEAEDGGGSYSNSISRRSRSDAAFAAQPMAAMAAVSGGPAPRMMMAKQSRAAAVDSAEMEGFGGADAAAFDEDEGEGAQSQPQSQSQPQPGRMLVRTGSVSLQTVEGGAVRLSAAIEALVQSLGGEVRGRNAVAGGRGGYDSAELRLGVPVEAFDRLLAGIRALLRKGDDVLERENVRVEDVTRQYVDVRARMQALESAQSQLLDLMKRAATVKEVLEVQRELRNLNAELESHTARAKHMERSSATSSLTVNIYEQGARPTPEPELGVMDRLARLAHRMAQRVGAAWGHVALKLVYILVDVLFILLPVLAIALAIGSVAWRWLRPVCVRLWRLLQSASGKAGPHLVPPAAAEAGRDPSL